MNLLVSLGSLPGQARPNLKDNVKDTTHIVQREAYITLPQQNMKTNKLVRCRIHDAINAHRHDPVLYVCAPMGYGKSIAVRHYLSEQCLDNIWVSALHDNDMRVWKAICNAIVSKREEAGRNLQSIGFPVVRYLIPQIIEAFKLVARTPLVIVIDDCHLLAEDSVIYHILFALAMEHINGLRIICITRSVPAWLLTEMRAKELCAVISADTLAFTEEEVLSYLNQRKALPANIVQQEAVKIREVSEGWIAAIVLLMEGVRQGRHVTALESTHDLFEYTLFQIISEEERVLLIKLGVLEEFTLSQAESILESSAVAPLVEYLHDHNTFITYNIDSNTYKIHALLRLFLSHKAKLYNIDMDLLYLSIARWKYTNHQYGEALNLYHKCHNIIEFFERISLEEYIHLVLSCKDIDFEIFKGIPAEMALRFPRMYIFISLCCLTSGVLERERFALKCIGMLRRYFVSNNHQHPQRDRILCELDILIHLTKFNDPFKIMDIRKCPSTSLLRPLISPVASTVALNLGVPSLLYCLYRKPGDLDELIAFAEKNFDCAKLAGLGYGFEKLLHAEVHFERGELDKARFYARQAIQKGWLREQVYIIACAHLVLARAAMLEGDSLEATTQLDIIKFEIPRKVSSAFTQETAHSYSRISLLCEMLFHSLMGNAEQVAFSIPDMHTFGEDYPYQGMGTPTLLKTKYHILINQFAEAEVLCDYYEKECVRYPSQLGNLRHKIFRAAINAHLYGSDAASISLNAALEEASRDDIVVPFVENAELILPYLEAIVPSEHLPGAFLSKVRALCLRSGDSLKQLKMSTSIGQLTRREVEVFRLLAKGLSQKNIATALCISIPTVKQHLLKIYAKLGVNNRVAALNKWFTMGF